ncbi:MAG: transglutaminase-like domain-containing protein [Verrucomicrobiota bacterium]
MSAPGPELNSILRLLDDDNPTVRAAVREKLASYGPELETALADAAPDLRTQAIALQRSYRREEFSELWKSWTKEPSDHAKLESGQALLANYLSGGAIDAEAISVKLDRLAAEFGRQFPEQDFRNLTSFLFRSGLFQGDGDRYYHPDNSNFAKVLSSRRGNPISLACVFILVGQRVGLDVGGCNYPAHFLARAICERDGELYLVDCFNEGKVLAADELIQHHPLVSHEVRDVVSEFASAEIILARVIRNLENAFDQQQLPDEKALMRRLWKIMAEAGEAE